MKVTQSVPAKIGQVVGNVRNEFEVEVYDANGTKLYVTNAYWSIGKLIVDVGAESK